MKKICFCDLLFVILTSVLAVTSASAASTTDFKYDDQYRLSKISRSDGTVIDYQYDDSGNRIRKIVSTPTSSVTAAFSSSVTSGQVSLSVTFSDQSTGPVTSWSWNFGDGTTSTSQNPSHTYTTAGSYTVQLTVVGASLSNSTTKTIVVSPDTTPPTVSFFIPANTSSLTVPITLSATDSSGVSGYMVSEINQTPSASDAGWQASPPSSYTFATEGTKTLYAWAKDGASNVSSSFSAVVTISLTGPPSNLPPTIVAVEDGQKPRIFKYGNNIHILNVDTNRYLKLYSSSDNGATFNSGVIISGSSKVRNGTELTSCIDSVGNIYVFWEDNATSKLNYMLLSANNGSTVVSKTILELGFSWADQPDAIVDSSNNTHLAFRASNGSAIELYYIKSTDTGQSFSTPIRITNNSVQEDYPRIAVHNSVIYVAYMDYYSTSNVLLTKSIDGATFSSPVAVNRTNGKADFGHSIGIGPSGSIIIPYRDTTTDGEGDVVVARSTDNGGTFSYSFPSSSNYRGQYQPKVLVSGTDVYLLWQDLRNNYTYDIFASYSNNEGSSYSADVNISNSNKNIVFKDVCISDGVLNIVAVNTSVSPFTTLLYKYSFNDISLPVVTLFSIPSTYSGLYVPVTSFTATDNLGIIGYCVTETNSSAECSWVATPPTGHNFTSTGSKVLYAWAKDASGNVSNSVTAGVTISLPPPPTPDGVTAQHQAAQSGIYISWNSVSNATNYKLYWSSSPGVTNGSNSMPPTTSTNYAHSWVQAGTTYYYRVAAVNSNGESILSNEVSATVPPATQTGTLAATASAGSEIFSPTIANYKYRYGPSIILNGNTFDMWATAPGPGDPMDYIQHRRGTVDAAGNVQWLTAWTNAIIATPGSLDKCSTADPSVVFFNGYYYIGYTSTDQCADGGKSGNQVFVARCDGLPNGSVTCDKWNGSGWGGNPQPIISYSGTGWGKGQPSFVVKDNILYMYYTDGGTKVVTVDATNANWPALINESQAITVFTNEGAQSVLGGKPGPFDVKYIDTYGKFIGLGVSGEFGSSSYIYVYESSDGISFQPVATSGAYWGTAPIQQYAHNIGISGDSAGHLDATANNFVAYGFGLPASQTDAQGYKARWPTYLNLISLVAAEIDTIKPIVTDFELPATSPSLTVNVTKLTATDNLGVTGYLLSESSDPPLANATGWSLPAPTTYMFTTEGSKTLYAWAKDVAGNVSDTLAANTLIQLAINGVCGSANGGTFPAAPSSNLCSVGTATTVSGSGPWTWTCQGINGGSNASCSANLQSSTSMNLLFEDDFNDDVLNPAYWQAQGQNVIEENGYVSIQENVTDTYSQIMTTLPSLASTVKVEMRHYMHAADNNFFPGISFVDDTSAGIAGLTWLRSGYSQDYCNISNGYDKVLVKYPNADVSDSVCAISDITSSAYYDQWITSTISYDATTGVIEFDVGGDGSIDYSTTIPEYRRKSVSKLVISGYGWGTGHYHNLDWIKVYTNGGSNPAVNGECGNSNGGTFTESPSTGLCTAGTATAVAGSGPWTWTCQGSNGGSDASCSANPRINGVCGSVNGGTLPAAPSANLCYAGTATTVAGTGPWTWACQGTNGGTDAVCGVSLLPPLDGKVFGGSRDDFGYSIKKTIDGGYIVAGSKTTENTGSDVYLIKLDASGNLQWERTFGDSQGDQARDVIQTQNGDYIVAGLTVSSETEKMSAYLIKTDSAGNKIWDKSYGGTEDTIGMALRQASDGGYMIVGVTGYSTDQSNKYEFCLIKTDVDGNLQWKNTYNKTLGEMGWDLTETNDGGYVMVGMSADFSSETWQAWIVKVDGSGNKVWDSDWGGSSSDQAVSVVAAPSGELYVAGATSSYGSGGSDGFLLKLNSTGQVQWHKTYGGIYNDMFLKIVMKPDGHLAMAGTKGEPNGQSKAWLMETDQEGNQIKEKTFWGNGISLGTNLTCDTTKCGLVGYTNEAGGDYYDVYVVLTDETATTFKLPDSGQTKCYQAVDPYAEIPCEGTGQDGAYSINTLSYTDNGNGTVTDNNTGLMWQKEDDNQTYNWYQASGTYEATYNPSSQNVCGSLTLGGHTDWRLPAEKELLSIVDYSFPIPGPTIQQTIFPDTKAEYNGYWSSTTNAREPGRAWGVYFGYANPSSFQKDDMYGPLYVRCVRGGGEAAGLADNGNGTVTDNNSGLMWQKEEPGVMSWVSALSYCEGLALGGHADWRLPNIRELNSLTDYTKNNPAIDTAFFPNAYSNFYWSSTTADANYPRYQWTVDFNRGMQYWIGKDGYEQELHTYYDYPARCVRGGQGSPSQTLTVNVTVSGTGSGTVTSEPSGITSNTSVTHQFTAGTSVTLYARPLEFSLFTGWSGDCSGTDDCVLSMNSDKNVTAVFDFYTAHKVKTPESHYSTLQEAYNAALHGSTVQAWGTLFQENLTCGQNKSIFLKGGYDGSYSMNTSYSLLEGILTIQQGSLTVENLMIK